MGEFVGNEFSIDNDDEAVRPGIGVPTESKEFPHMVGICFFIATMNTII